MISLRWKLEEEQLQSADTFFVCNMDEKVPNKIRHEKGAERDAWKKEKIKREFKQ